MTRKEFEGELKEMFLTYGHITKCSAEDWTGEEKAALIRAAAEVCYNCELYEAKEDKRDAENECKRLYFVNYELENRCRKLEELNCSLTGQLKIAAEGQKEAVR